MDLVVKTAASGEQPALAIRRMAGAANPDAPVGPRHQPYRNRRGVNLGGIVSTIWVVLSFAGVTLGLAAIGLYGHGYRRLVPIEAFSGGDVVRRHAHRP